MDSGGKYRFEMSLIPGKSALEVEAVGSSETSVTNWQITAFYTPEESKYHEELF